MHDNTNRFTGRAEDYDRYRQRYPAAEILAHLRDWCGLSPTWLVADIGAGTGMLADVFLANGNPVFAIEPNPDMRAQMEAQQLASQLQIIDATAEATTLPDASIDLVAAGRAFHWFDKDRALAEFRRILKSGGWVVLVAADRDRDSTDPRYHPQIDAYEQLLMRHGIDYTRLRSGYRTYDSMESFLDGELHQTQIRGERELDWPTLLGHTRSLSITPPADHPGYKEFESALQLHFDAHARNGRLTIPTICWITAGRFKTQ